MREHGVIRRALLVYAELVPKLREARILEDWAGLRPGTPDARPILGDADAVTPGDARVTVRHIRRALFRPRPDPLDSHRLFLV